VTSEPKPSSRDAPAAGDAPDAETLIRNWDELLQEIRVTQTGVQILTGFLLTVPFSAMFGRLTEGQRLIYLVVFAGSVLTTALVVAPVALHRLLFRRRRRQLLVDAAHACALAGLGTLALTISGVTLLVADVVLGQPAGWIAFAVTLAVLVTLWVLAAPVLDRIDTRPRNAPPGRRGG
jgi:hypothetical protein